MKFEESQVRNAKPTGAWTAKTGREPDLRSDQIPCNDYNYQRNKQQRGQGKAGKKREALERSECLTNDE